MSDPKAQEQQRIAAAYQRSTASRRGKRDGVVVTPVPVVDSIIRSTTQNLARHGFTLDNPLVQILDPFGGTGIFLARLIQTAQLSREAKVDLATRCRMVEIDPRACRTARGNLRRVMRQETGQTLVMPRVICADTFSLGDEVWAA